MNKQLPLRIVGDIGSRGALAKIEKGRKIMQREKERMDSDRWVTSAYLAARLAGFNVAHSDTDRNSFTS